MSGFDPTAESLHVGHLVALMVLRRFQQAGHRPIALVGGATGMIGDPSGKSEERNLLSLDVLRANVASIERQFRRFLDFEAGDRSAVLVNNYDWMGRFGYLEFLRDVGKHFPVGVMMAKESVKNRLERSDGGLSYTEFSYMLLQAYDFVHLQRDYGCEIQVGGSDQWGNITAGIDLARRMGGDQLYGMTCPLLTKSDGTKMGKTESGAVWLSAERTSPYRFYQYWINLADADVGRCLRFFTDLGQEEIVALEALHAADPSRREAQRRLAAELTRLVHGDDGLASAQRATEIFFGAEIRELSDAQLGEVFADVPSKELAREPALGRGASAARRPGRGRPGQEQGGRPANGHPRRGLRQQPPRRSRWTPGSDLADLASESMIVLRCGKKNYALLRFRGVRSGDGGESLSRRACPSSGLTKVSASGLGGEAVGCWESVMPDRYYLGGDDRTPAAAAVAELGTPAAWIVAAIAVVLVVGGVIVYRAVRHVPEFYRQALEVSREEQAAASDKMVKQVTGLASDVQKEGRWTAVFTADEINGWLAVDLVKNHRELLPPTMSDPRVVIHPDGATMACRYRSGAIDVVASLAVDVYMTSPGVVGLRLKGVRAGSLPLPLGRMLDEVFQATERLEWEVRSGTSEEGDPVVMISIPPPRHPGDKAIRIDAVELDEGEIRVAGTTGK